MKTKIFFLLICSLTWFQLEAQLLSIIESDNQSMVLEFQLESYEMDQLVVDGETIDIITAKKCGYFNVEGEPALPYYAESIIIPGLANPEIEISQVTYKEIKVNRIIPSKGPLPVGVNTDDVPFEFGEVYYQDKWYPEICAEIGEPYTLRDFNGVVLYFKPFLYNPKLQVLKIVTSISIKVTYSNNVVVEPKSPFREFQNIYKNHFLNYSHFEEKYPPVSDVGDMIIITTSEFMSAVEPLITWKNRKGIHTTSYLYPDETGSTAIEIKNFIQQIYDQTGTLTFILLVGDAADVPPATGYAGSPGYPADPVYTLLDGNDEYPDAFIGRFSVETAEEAEIVVNKNLWYEMNPDPLGEWYHKATGIASDEVFPPTPPDTVMVENMRQVLLKYGYTHVDQFYDPGATYTEFIAAIEEGRSMVNYMGHGSAGGWATTGMFNYLVTQLTNSFKTPVILSTACHVSSFAEATCFGEFWQRQGTVDEPQGSIAFMGCSITHYTVAGIAHPEMVNILVSEEYFTVGGFFTNGVMTAIDYDPGLGIGGGVQCFQSWLLFGDPSLCMYTDIPSEMVVDYSSYFVCGDTSLNISVSSGSYPVSNALVALYMNDSLFTSGYTDNDGIIELILSEPIQTPGIMELNVTARNKIPVFETVQVLTDITEFALSGYLSIAPNPCSGSAKLRFTIFDIEYVMCDLFEVSGVKVMQLVNKMKMPGTYEMEVDLSDLPKGIYFCVLKTSEGIQTKKIIKLD